MLGQVASFARSLLYVGTLSKKYEALQVEMEMKRLTQVQHGHGRRLLAQCGRHANMYGQAS